MGAAAVSSKQGQVLVPISYSLKDWEEELQTALNELTEIRSNRLGKVGIPQVGSSLQRASTRPSTRTRKAQ